MICKGESLCLHPIIELFRAISLLWAKSQMEIRYGLLRMIRLSSRHCIDPIGSSRHKDGSVQLRFEMVDAPEVHYGSAFGRYGTRSPIGLDGF